MAMDVGNWYADPAQRYNDVIYPQKDRVQKERAPVHYDRRAAGAERNENAPAKGLSAEAQKLLDKLKKTYGNVDFSVAETNNSPEARAKLAAGTGKYSVLFTNEELEKMASDPEYRNKMTDRMHEAFRTVAQESGKLGLNAIDPVTKGVVKSVGVIYDANGASSVYKELVDSVTAQKPKTEEPRVKPPEKQPVRQKEYYERKPHEKKYGKRGPRM